VPIPDPPVNYFPYAYLVYLAIGIAWILAFRVRKPSALGQIRQDLESSHARFDIQDDMTAIPDAKAA
jgi:hypothetical protein